MSTKKLSVNIYKLYIFCLPLGRLFDLPFGDFYDKVITQFSTLLMLIGVFMLLIENKKLFSQRNKYFVHIYFFMLIFSLLAASVFTFTLDNQYESPFSAILGDIILYFFVLLSIFYNTYCLSNYVSLREVYKMFNFQVILLLLVGYSQLLGMIGFSIPYDILSTIFSLRELSWLSSVDRGVTFFGSEPSSASLLCFVVIPYLYSCIKEESGVKRVFFIIALLLFTFLILCSNSSQLLILFFGSAIVFLWACFKSISKIFYFFSFTGGFIFALAYLNTESVSSVSNYDTKSIEYAILGKIVDRENLSTAMRASTVINDFKVFFDYPLTGVGDGIQGFFYAENQPSWTKSSSEVSELISTHTIPNGGGNFFPSYISAYGFIGIIFLVLFIRRYKYLYRTSILLQDKRIDLIFQISIILFLFAGWHVVGIKQSETMIFILSLPCVSSLKIK